MKKFLFTCCALALSLGVMAKSGDKLTLQAGSANVIWNLSSAFFELDFSEANVEGKSMDGWLQEKGDDFVRDWPKDKTTVETVFVSLFNKKTKKKNGLTLQTDNPNDSHKMIVHVQELDMGSIGGGVVSQVFLGAFAGKSGGAELKSGYVDVVDMTANTVVCRLAFKDVKAHAQLSWTSQLTMVLEELRSEMFGFADRFGDKQMAEIPYEGSSYASSYAETAQVEEPEPVQAAPVKEEKKVQKITLNNNKKTSQPAKKTAQTAKKTQTATPAKAQAAPAKTQASSSASSEQATVKLKNGTTISGKIKSFDPLTSIVLIIAGKETKIPMSQVANVETRQ